MKNRKSIYVVSGNAVQEFGILFSCLKKQVLRLSPFLCNWTSKISLIQSLIQSFKLARNFYFSKTNDHYSPTLMYMHTHVYLVTAN